MSFKIDLKARPIYKVVVGDLEVDIQPLNKRDDVKLVESFTKGNVRVLQGSSRRGFRKKEKDELLLPDVDHIGLNLERAKKTWKGWNIEGFACTEENIELMFENYYDDLVVPVLDKFDEVVHENSANLEPDEVK